MMTPEERQRVMDFILASQAKFVVRMTGGEKDLSDLETQLRRKRQKESLSRLLKASQNLVKASRNAVTRSKQPESQANLDKLIKLFRECLKANLRRPDHPKQDNS